MAPLPVVRRNLLVDEPRRQLELEPRYLEQNLQPISAHKRRGISGKAISATMDVRPDFQRRVQVSYQKKLAAIRARKLDRFIRLRPPAVKQKIILRKKRQGWGRELFLFVWSDPANRMEKAAKFIEMAVSTRKRIKFRDVFRKKERWIVIIHQPCANKDFSKMALGKN